MTKHAKGDSRRSAFGPFSWLLKPSSWGWLATSHDFYIPDALFTLPVFKGHLPGVWRFCIIAYFSFCIWRSWRANLNSLILILTMILIPLLVLSLLKLHRDAMYYNSHCPHLYDVQDHYLEFILMSYQGL
jgi:hypothetical protein